MLRALMLDPSPATTPVLTLLPPSSVTPPVPTGDGSAGDVQPDTNPGYVASAPLGITPVLTATSGTAHSASGTRTVLLLVAVLVVLVLVARKRKG